MEEKVSVITHEEDKNMKNWTEISRNMIDSLDKNSYIAVVTGFEYYTDGVTGRNGWQYAIVSNKDGAGFKTKKELKEVLKKNKCKNFTVEAEEGCYVKGSAEQIVECVKAGEYLQNATMLINLRYFESEGEK